MKINSIETNLPNPASVKQEQPSSLTDIETQQQAKLLALEIQKNIQTSPELAITAQVNVAPALLSHLLG